jgi:phosphatidate cytidylyltransferase
LLDSAPSPFSLGFLALLSLLLVLGSASRGRVSVPHYLRYLWGFFLLLSVADWISFHWAIWMFAGYAFLALREFFSLVDIRLQDRWGILGAYLSILFMTYFIHIDWYGMFIISIPVYAFLVMPFLVALGGGKSQGAVFSTGVIDLGLFLFVYCMGHIGYLAFFSVRIAILFVLLVALTDLVCRRLETRRFILRFPVAVAGALALSLLSSDWTGIPKLHSAGLGILTPSLVFCGHFTMFTLEEDLGVTPGQLEPGRGLVLDSLKAYLFAAPISFHYLRWFLHWGDL